MKNTVLVVDDSRSFRQVMIRFLQMEGYEVIVAAGGAEGLDKCRHHRPDLVVMDVHMPQMDGFAAVRELRSFSRVPVLMLSSGDPAAERGLGLKVGADAYLAKPFSGADFLMQVRDLMQTPPARVSSFAHGSCSYGSMAAAA
jgi:DNA-binding response OmpR family regulator